MPPRTAATTRRRTCSCASGDSRRVSIVCIHTVYHMIPKSPISCARISNTCFESSLDGPSREIRGSARVVDATDNAKLKVTFFWPFEGDYWIIELGEDYEYAVVGEPSRSFLWILSRTPQMDEELYESILARLPEAGYDPERLVRVLQGASSE
ncbi:MAG: lipocalin family protein [Phycisphaerae bacterium]|nr:lipocalin family protein [Phycisphaerae bacterium]